MQRSLVQIPLARAQVTCYPPNLNMDATDVNFVRDLFLRRKKSHAEISNIMKQMYMYPGKKGFSERTVRRFCLNNNIVRNRITTDELEEHVRTVVKVISLKLFYYQTFFETWRDEHS